MTLVAGLKSMRRPVVFVGVLAVFLTVALTVRSLNPDRNADEPASAIDGPVIAQLEPSKWLPLAQVTGHLTLEDGCLRINDQVVYLPYGSTWDEATGTINIPSRHRPTHLEVNDNVMAGGGFRDFDSLERELGPEALRVLKGCASPGETAALFVHSPEMPEGSRPPKLRGAPTNHES